jgi:hypothetical protein
MLRPVLALALAGAVVAPVAASAASAPAPIAAIATQTSSKQSGKTQRFTEVLRVKGKVVGKDAITCVQLTQATMKCAAVFTFTSGKVNVAGTVHFDKPSSKLAITGGTGTYAGAGGALTLKFPSDTKTIETFSFS